MLYNPFYGPRASLRSQARRRLDFSNPYRDPSTRSVARAAAVFGGPVSPVAELAAERARQQAIIEAARPNVREDRVPQQAQTQADPRLLLGPQRGVFGATGQYAPVVPVFADTPNQREGRVPQQVVNTAAPVPIPVDLNAYRQAIIDATANIGFPTATGYAGVQLTPQQAVAKTIRALTDEQLRSEEVRQHLALIMAEAGLA